MKDALVIIGFGLILIAIVLFPSTVRTRNGSEVLHIVEPRETLWSIAEKYNPHMDPREVIQDIRALNDVESVIIPGQQLRVIVWE
jgi:phosphohistidine phosphatase SixA